MSKCLHLHKFMCMCLFFFLCVSDHMCNTFVNISQGGSQSYYQPKKNLVGKLHRRLSQIVWNLCNKFMDLRGWTLVIFFLNLSPLLIPGQLKFMTVCHAVPFGVTSWPIKPTLMDITFIGIHVQFADTSLELFWVPCKSLRPALLLLTLVRLTQIPLRICGCP